MPPVVPLVALHRDYWLMVGCSPQRGQVAPSRAVGGDFFGKMAV